MLTPFAFGYQGRGREAVTALATGGGLIIVSSLTLLCWALAWRRRLRVDGVLAPRRSRAAKRKTERSARRSASRQARAERLVRASRQRELETAPDPAQVLTDLRALLTPLLSAADESVAIVPQQAPAPAETASVEVASVEVAPAELAPAELAPAELAPAELAQAASGSAVAVAEASRVVQAPGHLRGTRSASFFAVPRQAEPEPEPEPELDDSLLRGAELLMVGTGEEESW